MSRSTKMWWGRGIAVLWAGFWTWFSIAEAVTDPLGALVNHGWMVALMWVAVVLAWKRPKAGGMALLAAGLFVVLCFAAGWLDPHRPSAWFVIGTLGLPPLIAGILLLIGGGRRLVPGS